MLIEHLSNKYELPIYGASWIYNRQLCIYNSTSSTYSPECIVHCRSPNRLSHCIVNVANGKTGVIKQINQKNEYLLEDLIVMCEGIVVLTRPH